MVRKAFETGAPRWTPPDAPDCAAIAATLRHWTAERDADRVWRAEIATAREGNRRLRDALSCDLPALAGRLAPILAPGCEHARALSDLLAAAERFAALWPEPPARGGGPEKPWEELANTLAPAAHYALAHANRRRIGLPRSAAAPLAVVLVELLRLAGETVAAGTVGQHFTRYPYPEPAPRAELLTSRHRDL